MAKAFESQLPDARKPAKYGSRTIEERPSSGTALLIGMGVGGGAIDMTHRKRPGLVGESIARWVQPTWQPFQRCGPCLISKTNEMPLSAIR